MQLVGRVVDGIKGNVPMRAGPVVMQLAHILDEAVKSQQRARDTRTNELYITYLTREAV